LAIPPVSPWFDPWSKFGRLQTIGLKLADMSAGQRAAEVPASWLGSSLPSPLSAVREVRLKLRSSFIYLF
jgi:hypothetical protein